MTFHYKMCTNFVGFIDIMFISACTYRQRPSAKSAFPIPYYHHFQSHNNIPHSNVGASYEKKLKTNNRKIHKIFKHQSNKNYVRIVVWEKLNTIFFAFIPGKRQNLNLQIITKLMIAFCK